MNNKVKELTPEQQLQEEANIKATKLVLLSCLEALDEDISKYPLAYRIGFEGTSAFRSWYEAKVCPIKDSIFTLLTQD